MKNVSRFWNRFGSAPEQSGFRTDTPGNVEEEEEGDGDMDSARTETRRCGEEGGGNGRRRGGDGDV